MVVAVPKMKTLLQMIPSQKHLLRIRRPGRARPVPARLFLALSGLAVLMVGNILAYSGVGSPGAGTEKVPAAPVEERTEAAAEQHKIPWVPVCEIQGRGFSSPYEGQTVRTGGVVVADLDTTAEKGFYLQAPGCDGDESTSDGVMVYLGMRIDVASSGDQVEVTGQVQEYFGTTELAVSPEAVTVLSVGGLLPAPVPLAPPFDNSQARSYFEAREGMRVSLELARVVGPTSSFDETWVVAESLGLGRVFQDDPAGTGEIVMIGGRGRFRLDPPAQVGDRVSGLVGVLGFSGGEFDLLLTSPPALSPPVDREQVQDGGPLAGIAGDLPPLSFTAATFNLHNLFDPVDDPLKEDPVIPGTAYHRHLGKLAQTIQEALGAPTLLAVQEVENEDVLAALVSRPELAAEYGYVWLDGPDRRGIDVALLYREDRTAVLGYAQRQECTSLVDGLGPDGNQDMSAPQNALTCDLDGDGLLDGNRLFSRPPLEVHLRVCAAGCQLLPGQPANALDLWLLIGHFKSKSQDTEWNAYTLPRRRAQASFAAAWAAERQADPDAHVLVLGDLNDYPDSEPLTILGDAGLVNLASRMDRAGRYTYIYRGVSQVLDYVLASPTFLDEAIQVDAAHTNADFPSVMESVAGTPLRASDHDAVRARFTVLPVKVFLPLVFDGRIAVGMDH